MSNTAVSFKIGADNTEALKALKELRDEFKTLRDSLKTAATDLKIKVQTDSADVVKELQDIKKLFGKQQPQEIKVTTDMSDVTKELKEVNQHIQQTNKQLDNLGNRAANTGNVAARGLTPLAGAIKQVIAGYATLSSAKIFIGVTDEAKKFEGQLKLVTKSEQELIAVRQMLLDQSNRTGTQMASSVELYTKMYNATRNLDGANTGLLVRVTDIVNKFVAIGGSSGESANAAIIQLSQAMASGVLRGEELNSVMEQTPGLSKALADGLGVGIGELRKMAENGELTSDVVINALLKMGKTADEQFAKMPRQAAQATTALKNQVKTALADFDKQVGISATYVSILELVRENLSEIIDYIAAIGAATGITLFARQILIARDAIREKIAATIAARNAEVARTQAMLNTARHTAAQTALELNLARAELAAAQGATAQAAAQARLTAAKIADMQATRSLTAAQLAANTAMNAGAGAGRALLGVLGGPLGLITIIASVAAGFLLMRDNANSATDALNELGNSSEEVLKKFKELGYAQRETLLLSLTDELKRDTRELNKLKNQAGYALQVGISRASRTATSEQIKELEMLLDRYRAGAVSMSEMLQDATNIGGLRDDDINNIRNKAVAYEKLSVSVLKTAKSTRDLANSHAATSAQDGMQGVSQRPVDVDIDGSTRRLIDLKYTQESRARIVETYQIERQELIKLLDKHKSNATEQKKIKEQLYDLDAKYRRELSDYDKRISDENSNKYLQVTQEQYEYEKKLLDQRAKDNDQLYKNDAIHFIKYRFNKDDINKELHYLEIGRLNDQAKTATQHEKSLLDLKRKTIDVEHGMRADALQQEVYDFAKNLDKKKELILEDIEGVKEQISGFGQSEIDRSLTEVTNNFKKVHEKLKEIRDVFKDDFLGFTIELPNGKTVEINQDILDDIENQLIDQEITVKTKITLDRKPQEIQKNIDSIMSNYDYLSRYDEIRLAMNPMARPQIENNRRNNAQNTLSKLKDELVKLDQVYLKMLDKPNLFNSDDIKNVKEQVQELVIKMGELEIAARSSLEKFKTDLQETVVTATESGLVNFFMDLVEGTKSAKEALKDFARSFALSMAQVAAKALATYAIMQMLRLVPGGAAVAETLGMSMMFGKAHTGKVIDGKSQNVKVDENFRLAPNEVPTILEMGEEVLTANDPRHINNFDMNAHLAKVLPRPNINIVDQLLQDPEMSKILVNAVPQQAVQNNDSGQSSTVNVNTFVGDKFILEALETPAGEKTLLNFVENNATKITVILDDN